MTETNPTTPPETPPTPDPALPAEVEGSGRYAAFDLTYLRFVSGVHETKKAASDEAKAKGSKRFKIREV